MLKSTKVDNVPGPLVVGVSLYGTKAGGEPGPLVASGLEVGGSLYGTKAGGEVRVSAAAEPIKDVNKN